jgi:hypothetical protein
MTTQISALSTYPVTVNYDRSVEDGIAAGHYDWQNEEITSRKFPSSRTGTADLEIILVKFDDTMDSKAALRELDENGLRAAELSELLAFGEKYPDVQREFQVVALGSQMYNWSNFRITCLSTLPILDRDERSLHVYPFDSEWIASTLFAAVRK